MKVLSYWDKRKKSYRQRKMRDKEKVSYMKDFFFKFQEITVTTFFFFFKKLVKVKNRSNEKKKK